MNDPLLTDPLIPAFALVANALIRVRDTYPAPAPNDFFAVLATGAALRAAIAERIGDDRLSEAMDELCATYYPSLDTLPDLITRTEVREAVLGGIYTATGRARIGRMSLVLGIEYGIRSLAAVHLSAAREVSAAAHALLGEGRATRLRPVQG
jgi:hypothetical protein